LHVTGKERLLLAAPGLGAIAAAVLSAGSYLGVVDTGLAGYLWALRMVVDVTLGVALGLVVRRLHQERAMDPLTNLYSRRLIGRLLEDAVRSADTRGQEAALIMLDVDRFKAINDHYGHQMGDLVIADLGKIIRGALRPTDAAGRWGGDEFLVILPGADGAQGMVVAERLRTLIAAHRFGKGPHVIRVSVSFGVMPIQGCHSISEVLEGVDRAMYSNKERREAGGDVGARYRTIPE